MISNFRRPAAALLLGLGAGCWGASAAADTVQMSYSVKLVGLALGTAGLQATIEPSTYQVEVNAKLSGMASAVSKSEGAAQASGGIAQGRVLPNAYATTSSNSRETRTVRMALNSGVVRAVEITPPFEEPPAAGRVPVTDAHKRGVVDPLSALVMPATHTGPIIAPAACERTLPVYDGYTRFDVELSYVGQREVKTRGYSGPVVVCAARYKPVAGHRPDRRSTKFMTDNKNMQVWLMPVEGVRALAPYRISVGTMVGEVVIEATNVQVAETTRSQRVQR
jgi:hypothetical protein